MNAISKLTIVAAALTIAGAAQAHTLLIACKIEGANRISCKGNYSDGDAAKAAQVRVVTESDKLLRSGMTDANGMYSFAKPSVPFHVVLRTGAHHITNLSSVDIK